MAERRRAQAAEIVPIPLLRRGARQGGVVEPRLEQAAEVVKPRLEQAAEEGRRTSMAQINQDRTNLVQKCANPVQFQTGTISAPTPFAA